MPTQRSRLGLGLGVPTTESHRDGSGSSREPHERSHSLQDPFHYYQNDRSSERNEGYSLPAPLPSQGARSTESSRMMDAAASVVGMIPSRHSMLIPEQKRTCSDDTAQTLPDNAAMAHLELTRCRVRSEPAPHFSTAMSHVESASSKFPRADSLLQLGSDTASVDLRKLMSTRVRQAPPSIDTDKANASGFSSASSSPTKDSIRSSRLESEKSRPRVEVYFGLSNNVTVEGGYIEGTLTVRVRKPRRGEARHVRIDEGKMRVLGYEGVSESERHAFYQCATPLTEATTGDDCAQLFESQPDSEGFSIAREGTFTMPFKMHVSRSVDSQSGKNIPKGVIQDGSVSAAIKYILLISFKVRDDSDNALGLDKHAALTNSKTLIAHFYRHVEVWPTYGPMVLHDAEEVRVGADHSGTVSSRNAQGVLFGGTGMLHLTAVLHRKVWLAGQKCAVYIGAWNDTRKFVKTLSLTIIRKATVARPNQSESTSRKQIAEVTLDAVRGPTFGSVTGKGWWAGIEPGSSSEFSHIIDIPVDALTVPRTHVIDISYILRVSLVTGSLSSNVSVDLPFIIINAISTDGLPVPPPPGLLIESLKLPKHVPVSFTFRGSRKEKENIDLRTLGFPRGSPQESSILPRDYILNWTRQTLSHSPSPMDVSPTKSEFMNGGSSLRHEPQTSPQLVDDSVTCESVTNFIAQLESDLESTDNIAGTERESRSVRFTEHGHGTSSERNSVGPSILKAPSSAKHRVTFLVPTQPGGDKMDPASRPSVGDYAPGLDIEIGSSLPQQGRLTLRDDGLVPAKSDGLPEPHGKDIWASDDADAILRSIRLDNEGLSSYGSSGFGRGQEVILNRPFPGLHTASTSSSEPWSTSGATTTDYQSSADYHRSSFDAPDQDNGLPISLSRRPVISSAPGPQYSGMPHSESFRTEDTPRAGTVRRFQPEIVPGSVQASASRATMVPTISSPMLAKSQSAHVIGSPVNQYRRFMPQQIMMVPSPDEPTKRASYLSPEEKRTLNAGRTPWKATWNQKATSISRHLVDTGSSSSKLSVSDVKTIRAHHRSQSTPQPRDEHNSNMTSSQSTVRSRIAALEERSRGRPFSSYS